MTETLRTRITAYNSTFAIGGVSCSADSFVVIENVVLRMNICAEKPAHRKSAKRYLQAKKSPPHGQAHLLLRASAAKELALPHRHPNRIFTFYTQFFEIFKIN